MAFILCIETSTEICSVALSKDNQLLSIKEESMENSHAEHLMLFIDDVLKEADISINQISAVCFSEGPGSYTGLRIGLSTAKGLCYALKVPLIMLKTLQSMAWGARKLFPEVSLFCPMIDARRMEVYSAIYDNDLQIIEPIQNKIINADTFNGLLGNQVVVFCGNGVDKSKEILSSYPNSRFSNSKTSAAFMIELAFQKFQNQEFADIAYSEPFYLKEFIAGKPHIKGL